MILFALVEIVQKCRIATDAKLLNSGLLGLEEGTNVHWGLPGKHGLAKLLKITNTIESNQLGYESLTEDGPENKRKHTCSPL